MTQSNITFIGAGNMAQSLIRGLIADGYSPSKIFASSPMADQIAVLNQSLGIHTLSDNLSAAKQSDILVICVKPKDIKQVARELAELPEIRTKLIISIVAGVRINDIDHWLGHQCSIIRAMPNTPAMLSNGATGLLANDLCQTAHRDIAESIMRAVGVTVWLKNEGELDTVTALSGSGPAYFFFIMEAMEKAAIAEGLSEEAAHLLTTQTALGAAHMAMQSPSSIASLREQVTSKGGTTEKALKVLTDAKVETHVINAILAAKQRANEIADLFHHDQGN